MPVELARAHGQHNAVAYLKYQPRRPRNVAIVAGHGYSSSKHNLDPLCGFLASHGFTAYSLDFPGHKLGCSGGELRGIADCIDAMRAVHDVARSDGYADLYLLGHSMGAMTALLTAASLPTVRGVVAIATGYGRPSALATLRAAGASNFRSDYVVGVDLPTLVDGIDAWYDDALPKLSERDLLFVSATRDAMVNARSVRELYERSAGRSSLVEIDSDHTNAGEHARASVLAWLDQRHPRQ